MRYDEVFNVDPNHRWERKVESQLLAVDVTYSHRRKSLRTSGCIAVWGCATPVRIETFGKGTYEEHLKRGEEIRFIAVARPERDDGECRRDLIEPDIVSDGYEIILDGEYVVLLVAMEARQLGQDHHGYGLVFNLLRVSLARTPTTR
jgi:hypothetical protein